MMFNKILVLASGDVKIQDYLGLAKEVFKNLNPATDISFSAGPMDVLDHSCSKMGFGGKMCIDGTLKFEEEKDEHYANPAITLQWNNDFLKDQFVEIKSVNSSLIKKDIPCLILSVEKKRNGHIKDLHEQICNLEALTGIKLILYVEHTVNAGDLTTALWRFCNNLDPKRDFHLFKKQNEIGKYIACMGLDGTRKTKDHDNFQRDWPNIIVADEATIKAVDEKWDCLGIGTFIQSPSLKYKDQLYGEEAVVE